MPVGNSPRWKHSRGEGKDKSFVFTYSEHVHIRLADVSVLFLHCTEHYFISCYMYLINLSLKLGTAGFRDGWENTSSAASYTASRKNCRGNDSMIVIRCDTPFFQVQSNPSRRMQGLDVVGLSEQASMQKCSIQKMTPTAHAFPYGGYSDVNGEFSKIDELCLSLFRISPTLRTNFNENKWRLKISARCFAKQIYKTRDGKMSLIG